MAQWGDMGPWRLHRAGTQPARPLPPNQASFLAAIAQKLALDRALLVGENAEFADDAAYSLRIGSDLLWLSCPADATSEIIAAVQARLTELGARFDLILLDSALAALAQLSWLSAAPSLLSENGLLVGGVVLAPSQADVMTKVAVATGLSLHLADQFWFASRGVTVVPDSYQSNIAGAIAPIHFASMDRDLGVIGNREAFLQVSQAGIACRYHQGGGVPFTNPLPENFASAEDMLSQVSFIGGYLPNGQSDGASLRFLRNVTMSGRIGILYDSQRGAYQESFSTSRHFGEFNRPLIHEHDHFMRQGQFSVGDAAMPHLGSFFPNARHLISQPVVMINSWDLWCYNHWVNYTLSRFWYLDVFPELRRLPIVIGPISRRFQRDYLDMLGLADATFIQHHQTAALELAAVYHPSLADPPQFTAGSVQWLRDHFLPHAASLPEGFESGLYYISRGDAGGRGITNDSQIFDLIEPYGFRRVEFGHFSVRQQIALMRHAKVVIGPHGSSLTNLVFMSPGCRVLDLITTPSAFRMMKGGGMGSEISFVPPLLGGRYFALTAATSDDVNNPQANYGYDLDAFKRIFSQLMA